jgi:EAL domain-containing protein (putative c-di-GMP-specific phosphodiesterase class I)
MLTSRCLRRRGAANDNGAISNPGCGPLIARLALQSSLEAALDNNEFFLEYQPIVSLVDSTTDGFEALLRWQHPTRGRLSPDEFIDVAEESGLISPIGEWVMATAFSAARRWRDQVGDSAPYVAINVSARHFHSRGFVGACQRLLAESGIPATQILLEITESLLLRRDGRAWKDLKTLRDAGVRIAIDDFGTGYSALSYLATCPWMWSTSTARSSPRWARRPGSLSSFMASSLSRRLSTSG